MDQFAKSLDYRREVAEKHEEKRIDYSKK